MIKNFSTPICLHLYCFRFIFYLNTTQIGASFAKIEKSEKEEEGFHAK